MPLVTMRQILDHAAENNYGVPAFNFNDMEQVLAVLQAARKVNAPVILQTSTGARKFAGDPMIRNMVKAGIEMFPELPICLHQDHGSSVDICQSAIVNGYSSVMMDGSLEADGKTPSSFEYNVKVTKEVVARAHAVGASVEGELGVIGSLETGKGDKEDGHGAEGVIDKKRLVTDPDEAFVMGGTWRVPVMEGLQPKSFITEMKMDGTYNDGSFSREYESQWSGDAENAFFSADKFDRHRVLL